VITLERGEAQRGRVLDARGAAVRRARLAVSSDPAPRQAVTDADGRFAIDRLARGGYRLLVGRRGWPPPSNPWPCPLPP
jgi:hypothetical protein